MKLKMPLVVIDVMQHRIHMVALTNLTSDIAKWKTSTIADVYCSVN